MVVGRLRDVYALAVTFGPVRLTGELHRGRVLRVASGPVLETWSPHDQASRFVLDLVMGPEVVWRYQPDQIVVHRTPSEVSVRIDGEPALRAQ